MNAGLYGLPGGEPARRVRGLVSASGARTGVTSIAQAASAQIFTVATIASTWQRIAAISGRGCVNWLGFYTQNTATYSVQLVLDGVVVASYGPTSLTASGASGTGLVIVGGGMHDNSAALANATFQTLYFERSLELNILCTTGGFNAYAGLNAEVHQ